MNIGLTGTYHSERVVISDAARRSAITGPLLPEVGLLTNLKVFAGDAFGIIGHLATVIGLATSLGKSRFHGFLSDIARRYGLTRVCLRNFPTGCGKQCSRRDPPLSIWEFDKLGYHQDLWPCSYGKSAD